VASLVPVGPDLPPAVARILTSHAAALRELLTPTQPRTLASVDLKSDLSVAGYTAPEWPNGHIICAEINSIVVSTLVAGTWTWLRADGGAL